MVSSKQLRYFHALARTGHFGRAAALCSVTQPALSMQIMQMEDLLGLKLIERRGGACNLTSAGREIAQRAADILGRIESLTEYAASCQKPFSTPIRMGIIPTIAPYMLPRFLPVVRKEYPELRLNIREAQTKTLMDSLRSGTLDLLLIALPAGDPDIHTHPLRTDTFYLALPPQSEAGKKVKITPATLPHEQLLLLEEGHCLRDQALSFCQTYPQDQAQIITASSLSTLMQLVSNGLGITFIPEIAIAQETALHKIRLQHFSDPEPHRVIALAWRRSSHRSQEFEILAKIVNESMVTFSKKLAA